jgi:hypothetical protein
MPRLKIPPVEGYKCADNQLKQLRPYVVECLRRLGKNPYYCELCLPKLPTTQGKYWLSLGPFVP